MWRIGRVLKEEAKNYKRTGRLLCSKKMSPVLIHVASFIRGESRLLLTSKQRRKAGGNIRRRSTVRLAKQTDSGTLPKEKQIAVNQKECSNDNQIQFSIQLLLSKKCITHTYFKGNIFFTKIQNCIKN